MWWLLNLTEVCTTHIMHTTTALHMPPYHLKVTQWYADHCDMLCLLLQLLLAALCALLVPMLPTLVHHTAMTALMALTRASMVKSSVLLAQRAVIRMQEESQNARFAP